MIRPLEGITILDLSSILMVPYCTRILADLGADVIKIESLVGDNTRYIGPYENKSMGAVFLNLNSFYGLSQLFLDVMPNFQILPNYIHIQIV